MKPAERKKKIENDMKEWYASMVKYYQSTIGKKQWWAFAVQTWYYYDNEWIKETWLRDNSGWSNQEIIEVWGLEEKDRLSVLILNIPPLPEKFNK